MDNVQEGDHVRVVPGREGGREEGRKGGREEGREGGGEGGWATVVGMTSQPP